MDTFNSHIYIWGLNSHAYGVKFMSTVDSIRVPPAAGTSYQQQSGSENKSDTDKMISQVAKDVDRRNSSENQQVLLDKNALKQEKSAKNDSCAGCCLEVFMNCFKGCTDCIGSIMFCTPPARR